MGASDLPLDIRQRIESRWSAQIKRQQQRHELETRAASPPPDDNSNACDLIDIAAWGKPRTGDR